MKNKIMVILVIVILLIAVGIGGYWFFLKNKKGSPVTSQQVTSQESKETDLGNGISVKEIDSNYKIASDKSSGFFKSGQEADIMLSGFDFNNTGGALHFNHLGSIASDGKHLILADRNNNRVLIWNKIPTGNNEPDLVLGQKDFITNSPGTELDNLNWPVGVATDGTHLLVSDTYNDRVLIWNSIPTQNGQPADLELKGEKNSRVDISWPWQIWTNGQKVVVTSTGAAKVLIYNSFPTYNNQKADVILDLKDAFGTPRSVGSDGKSLIVGDHNAKINGAQGNFFWKTFPAEDNQNYDFFMASLGQDTTPPPSDKMNNQGSPPPPPLDENGNPLSPPEGSFDPNVKGVSSSQNSTQTSPSAKALSDKQNFSQQGDIFWSPVFTNDGKIITLAGGTLGIWDSFPNDENDVPKLKLSGNSGPKTEASQEGYSFKAGDGSGLVMVDDKLYLSLSNDNKIVAFNSIPAKSTQSPDFAIGSPDINTNTLETDFIISNPVPVSNGKSLFVSSDFDNSLYVWKSLPDESGAHPNLVYSLPEGPWDNTLYKNNLVLAGKSAIFIWKKLPTEPLAPDIILNNTIGNISLGEIRGVALDEKYLYLSDEQNKKIYIWEGIPDENSNPKFTISTQNNPGRLSSDGNYLAVTYSSEGNRIDIYEIDNLSENSKATQIGGQGTFNLPQGAEVKDGHLFVGDTGFNRVHIWKNIEDAIAGKNADTMLGLTDIISKPEDAKPKIGKSKLFWPSNISFDGSYLWIGEFKFSERILRFSIQ